MACMDRVMELNFRSTDEDAYFQESHDWSLKHVFQDPRNTEAIKAGEVGTGAGWRMKERMKTVSVALVLCLNVGVDPPGVIKLQPCARLECWVDPLSPAISPQKALEQIGQNLQKQYERWQPRARYKQSLDPTVDEVKKLCTSLRRNAKEERVLFHFVGHGVPAPTTNGEIWVFNRNYTQYIPLSIYDLQTWMGYPSIYVFDCNNAGIIVKSFHQFAEQHEREFYSEADKKNNDEEHSTAPNFSGCILLGACGENQLLPMNPDLPADLFTSCLTTPIRTSLRWFVLQNQGSSKNSKVPANKLLAEGITLETVERVPGQLNDRRTMLGEINWIFTAITDTIAFQHLPKHLFQKLFRQDLLVASLFRNFLLAERIMRSYQVTPVSSPRLPPTYQNEMWHAWDYALDQCLSQLKSRESSPPEVFPHTPSPFFEEQLTAFEVWLELGNEKRRPPEQLPIVLQVLLSQVHRVRALELLGKFLNLGSWAVNLALSVGIFPYVLKLLQSSAKELRSLLVYIWAKILAVDGSCKSDLTRENSHRYFINLITDNGLSTEHRTYAVFVLCNIVRNYSAGQQAALQANSIATCLFALEDPDNETPDVSNLHKWVCICLGLTWQDFPSARWCGVRDSAHEKIGRLLDHEHPEVRAAAVFALGCFVNGIERTEHSSAIDHAVILMVLNKLSNEASSLVRQEIVVALHNFVLVFENQFVILAEKQAVVESQQGFASPGLGSLMSPGTLRTRNNRMRALLSNDRSGMTITGGENPYGGGAGDSMRRVASSSSLSNLMNVFIPPAAVGLPTSAVNQMTPQSPTPGTSNTLSSIYSRVFNHIVQYERDPHPGVAILSRTVLEYIRSKAIAKSHQKNALKEMESSGESARSGQSPKAATPTPTPTPTCITPIIATKFIDWCWSQVCKPSIAAQDPQDPNVCVRSWVYGRNARIRRDCFKRVKVFPGKIEDQVVSKSLSEVVRPGGNVVRFHAYENLVVVGGPAVLETPSSANSSASGSLTSLESTRTNTHVVTDKSVFLVFEYDDSSALSATHDQSPSASTPQQPASPSTTAARLLNKTEIEHTNGGFNSGSPFISAIEWLNAHDTITTSSSSLIATGCNDGCVRVYKPNTEAKSSSLVTAWSVSPASRVHGLKMRYQVEATNLVVGFHGTRNTHVLVYDCEAERMVREIGQVDKNQSSVFGEWWLSAMDCNRSEPNVFVLGGDDGSVKLLDFRLPVTEAITQTWRDFSNDRTSSSVQTVRLRYDRTVVSGNSNGRVRFFDLRSKTPTKTIDTTTDVTSLDIHGNLPYFGIGTSSGVLNVFGFQSQTGFLANSIREGFAGFGRIGLASNSISSVAFHDFKPFVAFVDSYSHFSVYKARK